MSSSHAPHGAPILLPELTLHLAPWLLHHRKAHIARYILVCRQWRRFFEKLLIISASVNFVHGADPHEQYAWIQQLTRNVSHVHMIRLFGDAVSNLAFTPLWPQFCQLEAIVITTVDDTIAQIICRNAPTLHRISYRVTSNREGIHCRLRSLHRLFVLFAVTNDKEPNELAMINGMIVPNSPSTAENASSTVESSLSSSPWRKAKSNKSEDFLSGTNLLTFELSYMFLVDQAFFTHMARHLVSLYLNHCHITLPPSAADILAERPEPVAPQWALFPNIQFLNLKKVAASIEDYCRLIKHCPLLQGLVLRPYRTTNNYAILSSTLVHFPPRQIKMLDVLGSLSDQQLVWLLQALPGLKTLNAGFTGFGELSTQWVVKNCGHRPVGTTPLQYSGPSGQNERLEFPLCDLDIFGCGAVTSAMIDLILQTCSNITRFHAGVVELNKQMFFKRFAILNNETLPPTSTPNPASIHPPSQGTDACSFSLGKGTRFLNEHSLANKNHEPKSSQSQPHHHRPHAVGIPVLVTNSRWNCFQLRDLRLTLSESFQFCPHVTSQVESLFWCQIAQFTQLERLSLSNWNPAARDVSTGSENIPSLPRNLKKSVGFSWTVEDGLVHLITLTRLKYLAFEGFQSQMGRCEIDWMRKHWMRLETLHGTLELDVESYVADNWPGLHRIRIKR